MSHITSLQDENNTSQASLLTQVVVAPVRIKTYKTCHFLSCLSLGATAYQRHSAVDPSRQGLRKDSERDDMTPYLQNGNVYPDPHDFNIYTDYLKSLYSVVPGEEI